jgi:hypothetical protein
MKTKLLFAVFLTGTLLQAQSPVLNSSGTFAIGDSVLLHHKFDASLSAFTPGPAGANVTWDFTTMDFDHPSVITDTLVYIDPAGTPFYTDTTVNYSLANLCFLRKTEPFSFEQNDYNYFISNGDSLVFLGHWADNGGTENWENHYPNPLKQIVFPFGYSDTFTDTFTQIYLDMSGSDYHYINGTNTVTADGYGTLIVDSVPIPDVLRIHSVAMITDSNNLFGVVSRTEHTYRWYAAGKKGFVLTLNMSYFDTTEVVTADYQKQFNYNTSVPPAENQLTLRVYPNPASENIMLDLPDEMIAQVRILDLSGKVILQLVPNQQSNVLLPLTGITGGQYIIEVTTDKRERVYRKIVVKR